MVALAAHDVLDEHCVVRVVWVRRRQHERVAEGLVHSRRRCHDNHVLVIRSRWQWHQREAREEKAVGLSATRMGVILGVALAVHLHAVDCRADHVLIVVVVVSIQDHGAKVALAGERPKLLREVRGTVHVLVGLRRRAATKRANRVVATIQYRCDWLRRSSWRFGY